MFGSVGIDGFLCLCYGLFWRAHWGAILVLTLKSSSFECLCVAVATSTHGMEREDKRRETRCVLGVCGGSREVHNALSVCEDGRLVMSWLAGPKAHWACEGVTWLGHRGVSLTLFYWIRLWREAALHPAATDTQPANHSLVLSKSGCISNLKLNYLLFFLVI